MTNDRPQGKLARYVVLVAVLGFLAFRVFDRPGDRLWRFREIGRGADALVRGDFAAPSASSLLVLALLVGGPLIGLSTLFLRQRVRAGLAPDSARAARGCAGHLAGAFAFTFAGPFLFLSAPILAVPVSGAFLLRAFALLPTRGRLGRRRLLLLLGVSVYWLLYWAYETPMEAWSRSVSGAIRADIVLIYPLLYLVGAAGVWLSFDRWSEGRDETVRPGLNGRVGV